MESTQNATYFEAQLLAAAESLNNAEVDFLISEMILHAQELETEKGVIPPGQNQTSKPKPVESRAAEFRDSIEQISSSINSELLTLFQAFLAYIESLENMNSN